MLDWAWYLPDIALTVQAGCSASCAAQKKADLQFLAKCLGPPAIPGLQDSPTELSTTGMVAHCPHLPSPYSLLPPPEGRAAWGRLKPALPGQN